MRHRRKIAAVTAILVSMAMSSIKADAFFRVENIESTSRTGCTSIKVSWLGHENKADLAELFGYLIKNKAISRKEHGGFIARNMRFGDKQNTLCIPAEVAYRVWHSFTRGQRGYITMDPRDNSSLVPGYEYASIGMIASGVPINMGLEKIIKERAPDYFEWVKRSWV